jgi:ABC-type branched-subunit amino acid transport system ATPase component
LSKAISGLPSAAGPVEILRGLDVTVGPGERVALMGSNGAGKSTLLRTVAGVYPSADGTREEVLP